MPDRGQGQGPGAGPHDQGLIAHRRDLGDGRGHDVRAFHGFRLGAVGRGGGLGGVAGHFQDRGVDFLHGRGGFPDAPGLDLRTLAGLVDTPAQGVTGAI